MAASLTILAISDLHYMRRSGAEGVETSSVSRLSLEWTRRAIREARRLSAPAVIALLGDVVDDRAAAGAEMDSADVAALLQETGLPVIVAPGNHVVNAQRLLQAFNDRTGVHRIKGYALYSFSDAYGADDTCARSRASIEEFLEASIPEPLIAIQHSPVYPPVDSSEYPYMPANVPEIMESYRRKAVFLSISGHYHAGQELAQKDGTTYLTCPALVQPPFSFCIIRVRGRDVQVERHALQFEDGTALVDGHVHTHFGYCAVDVHPVPVRERIQRLGLKGVACVEHAGQLYLSADSFWGREHVENPGKIPEARKLGQDRVAAFRAAMDAFRSESFAVGLEVECDRDGRLTLLDEDRHGWDVILGALHWLPSCLPADTPARFASSFLTVTEQLVCQGISALAHPFRIFRQARLPEPAELYRPVARLLRENGVAAEINFHHNDPEPEFFRICFEEGARIVLGSDGHSLDEVGDLRPHLRLLRQIGYAL